MRYSLPLCAIALVAPIIASPAPKRTSWSSASGDSQYSGSGASHYSGSENSGKKQFSPAVHSSYPGGKNSGKKEWSAPPAGPWHKTNKKHNKQHKTGGSGGGPTDGSGGSYPTMTPTGGFSGGPTGTGGMSEPTNEPLPGGQGGYKSGKKEKNYPTGTGSGGTASGGTGSGGTGSGGTDTGSGGAGSGTGSGGTGNGTGTGTGSGSNTVPSSPATGNGTVVSNGGITLPAGCSTKNGIGIGWLPGTDEKIGDIQSALGVTACTDGQYAQITSNGAYSDSSDQLLSSLTQIVGGKTIFVASLMPSIALNTVDATVAGGVAAVMKQFTDKGIEVWLRFAHEMNWYVTDGTYHGTAADFQKAWAAVSTAVEGNSQVKMFWSPNEASAADIESGGWFPTSGKVDIVGIDIYPKSQQTFGQVYGDFCKTFSNAKNIPFAIGETGAGPSIKEYWLGQLATGDKTACPNYVGFSYFDYNKEEDFRVVSGSNIAKSVLG